MTTTGNTVIGNAVTCPNVKGALSLATSVRVIGINLTGEVPYRTKDGHVDVTTVGGVEVAAVFSITVGP